jgi:hypothetical protein
MATLYLLAEEPVQNDQQQDCCLIVEVHAPDGIDNRWVQRAENAVKAEFGPGLRLWSAHEHETFQYLEADPGAHHGSVKLIK